MRILYFSLNAEFGANGDESKGYSYEKTHIWDAWDILQKQRDDLVVDPWWIDQDSPEKLEEMIKHGEYDLIFGLPVNWHNDAPFHLLIAAIEDGVPVVEFDCDPLRRFDNPSDPWILERARRGLASHFLTPAPHMLPVYHAHGLRARVMHFGCPSWIDRMPDVDQDIDISFIGQMHGIRQQVIDELRNSGFRVHVFGRFWPNHPDNHNEAITDAQMNEVFNRSKINLNLTWISQPPYQHQIKGRHFELLGAGACQLATYGQFEMQGLTDVMSLDSLVQVFTIGAMKENLDALLEAPHIRKEFADRAYTQRTANLWTSRLSEFLDYWPEFK